VLDQHCKHQLQARHYGRYVDDFYLLDADPQRLVRAHADIAAFLPARLHCHLNPRKTVLQPLDRGIDFVGHVIKPWRRTTRPRTVARAVERLQTMDRADVFTAGNSYLGLVRQASHSYREQVAISKPLLRRGFTVAGDFEKVLRGKA
jgi:RNA-directed DNA polymerase